jgi:hypothetical protein
MSGRAKERRVIPPRSSPPPTVVELYPVPGTPPSPALSPAGELPSSPAPLFEFPSNEPLHPEVTL